MSYVNNYTPPLQTTVPASELYGPEPYDINFAYPIHDETLQNSRTKLVPFVPAVHAETYWAHVGHRPEVFRYYPFTLDTLADFLAWYELNIRRGPFTTCFAVIDKTRPNPEHPEWGGSMAGVIGMFYTSPEHLHTEAGYVVVFPDFQKTHVAKDMVGLLLRYVLELPSASPPGLGLRRVKWSAHPKNIASIGLAKRMGFRIEGTAKWVWVLPDHLATEAWPGRIGDACSGKAGRHSTTLALCWDDWEDGERERVETVLSD